MADWTILVTVFVSVLITVPVAPLKVRSPAHLFLIPQIGAAIVFALIIRTRVTDQVRPALPEAVAIPVLVAVLASIHRAAIDHYSVLGPCGNRTEEQARQQNSRPLYPSNHGSSSLLSFTAGSRKLQLWQWSSGNGTSSMGYSLEKVGNKVPKGNSLASAILAASFQASSWTSSAGIWRPVLSLPDHERCPSSSDLLRHKHPDRLETRRQEADKLLIEVTAQDRHAVLGELAV